MSRRRLLAATGAATVVGLSGCSQGGDDGGSPTGTSGPAATASPTFSLPDCEDPETLAPSDVADGGTVSAGCYRAESSLAVEDGTLTLEPGVVIEFASDVGLEIESEGRLQAEGTTARPVVLTGTKEERGHWMGLYFRGSQSSDNALEKTVVQYGGGGSWNPNFSNAGILLRESTVALKGVVLRANSRAGVIVRTRAGGLSMSNTRFEANELPAWVHADVAGAFSPDTAFDGNDESAVRIGIDGADTVVTEQTWQDPGVPFHVRKHVELEAPVTVSEGVTFRFGQEKGLNVRRGGRLTVAGAADAPVTFTGREDLRGSWKGIRYETTRSADNLLEHAVVEYAGDSAWNPNHSPAGVFVRGDTVTLAVRNSTFRENATMGLSATGPGADLTIEGNSFEENAAPLLLQANLAAGIAADNAFANNDEGYVYLGDPGFGGAWTTVTDSASWPALEVPYRPRVNVGVEAPLRLDPGTTFAFEQGRGMRVRDAGRLSADASGGETITFAGAEDITGFWRGLYFTNSLSADNVLANVVIENGGNSEWRKGAAPDVANLFVRGGDDAAAVAISDATIRGSGKYGIGIGDEDARVMDCGGVTFENNAGPDTFNLDANAPIPRCQ